MFRSLPQDTFYAPQIGDFLTYCRKMVTGQFLDFAATVAALDKAEQRADFVEGKPQFTGSADKCERTCFHPSVDPPAAPGSWRKWQQLDFFIVTDRLAGHVCPPGQFTNGNSLHLLRLRIFRTTHPKRP